MKIFTDEERQRGKDTRQENARLRAEAIAIMKMNNWSVVDIARKLGLRPATVKAALKRGA